MSELYNAEYYHEGCGPIPYEQPEHWVEFFGVIADKIVADLHPKTVLDAGCAMGYLVAALRDRGVEAYGVDISEYAISQVREDIRPYCKVGSLVEQLPEGLPAKYDLVVTIEVLEHLYEDEGKRAIQNLCKLADQVLFSSTPDDFTERTHVNVQQREYWCCAFFENGFLDDINYRPRYLTSYAVLFRRSENFGRQVEDYERVIARYESSAVLKNSEYISKIYFDMGDGMSEESCISLVSKVGNRFSQHIFLPKGCKSVRFDPVEGMGCLIWNIKARTESEDVSIDRCNGLVLGNSILFKPNDPQIYFDSFEQEYQYIKIDAEILPLQQDGWMYFCKSIGELLGEKAQLETDIQRKTETIHELNEKLKHAQSEAFYDLEKQKDLAARQLEEVSGQCASDIEVLQREVAKLQEDVDSRDAEIRAYSDLVAYERQEHAKVVEAYQVISNSTFWKATKPGRIFVDILKSVVFRPVKKIVISVKVCGLYATARKVRDKIFGRVRNSEQAVSQVSAVLSGDKRRSPITGNPVDGIETILVSENIKRLNLVTDTIDASSLLGGVATALIVATEFANRYNYELRIITRNTETNPMNYENIMKISGVKPAEKLSFYSDYERFDQSVDFRMEVGPGDIFFATSWWSAQAIKSTTINPRFFYIIQEVETFFYNYGSERLLCEQIMEDPNIDFIVNSHYLHDYFVKNNPNITKHGCYFEPAFPSELYSKKDFMNKNKYKLFFYARPNNPRNLYTVGVELLQKAVDRGVLNLEEWDVYCVGQDAPIIHFSTGKDSINMGQLSWTEYAKFLADVDLGLCLMYTPHPSYPPFDVASSGGVVLTNKMLNKQTFDMCQNVIMEDLNEEDFMRGFEKAVALAKDTERRQRNYEESTIPRNWSAVLNETMTFMKEACDNV